MNKIIGMIFLCMSSVTIANFTNPEVDRLLMLNTPPDGVVFELVEGNSKAWKWAAPMIKDLKTQLRSKYPDIDIAIVSHGYEQFQLTKQRALRQKGTVSILEDLVRKDDISLHVCGTHSSWYDVPDKDYIDIVDIALSGPAKVNDYVNLGYELILLENPIK